MSQNDTPESGGRPLLGLRSTIVLLLGVLVGVGAGLLTYLAQRSVPAALLAAGAGFGAGVQFFHSIIS